MFSKNDHLMGVMSPSGSLSMIKMWPTVSLVAMALGATPAMASAQENGSTPGGGATVAGPRFERTDTPDQMRRGRDANPNDRVCRAITATGSRLGSRRVCRTRAEWDVIARDTRETTESIQRQTRVPGG